MKSNTKAGSKGNETLLLAKRIACMMLFVSALVTLFFAADIYAAKTIPGPSSDGHEPEAPIKNNVVEY